MAYNSKYNDKLEQLRTQLREDEKAITDCKTKIADYEASVPRYTRDAKTSVICLLLSLILTALAVWLPFTAQFQTLTGADSPASYIIYLLLFVQLINVILVFLSIREFLGIMLIFIIPPIILAAPFVYGFMLIREAYDNASLAKFCKHKLPELPAELQKCQDKKDATQKEINGILELISKANRTYTSALADNDITKMKEAAEEGSVEAQEYIKGKDAEKLYNQAIATEPADETLMQQSADLNYAPACLHIGKNLMAELGSPLLTASEKSSIMQKASAYLEKAMDKSVEAEFLWISAQAMYISNTKENWRAMLNRLREIKSSGQLEEYYAESMDTLISSIVQIVDSFGQRTSTDNKTPKQQKWHCKFYNAGICNHQSTSAFVHHCTFPSSPYLCEHARTYKAYELIEY